MSLHTRFILLLVALTAASIFSLVRLLELSFPAADLVKPSLIVVGLGLFAEFYRRRQNEQFVTIIAALMQIVAYSTCFTTLMYAVCALNRPLVDAQMMRFDAACGIHLPSIVEWAKQHPAMQRVLSFAYSTMLPQTALIIAVLGFANQRRELQGFVRQFLLSSLVVLAAFALWPAAGPFVGYDYPPACDQARYLAHFESLRSGERTLITWRDAEGLITFPSFHTAWALLLISAVRRNRWLLAPSVLLNLAVIVSTLTTGWHYFADVCSGVAVAVVAIAASHALEAVFEQQRVGRLTPFPLRQPVAATVSR
ncbi:MAG: phosphatase PAP2 family protein [Planctomycetaceae bacterium]